MQISYRFGDTKKVSGIFFPWETLTSRSHFETFTLAKKVFGFWPKIQDILGCASEISQMFFAGHSNFHGWWFHLHLLLRSAIFKVSFSSENLWIFKEDQIYVLGSCHYHSWYYNDKCGTCTGVTGEPGSRWTSKGGREWGGRRRFKRGIFYYQLRRHSLIHQQRRWAERFAKRHDDTTRSGWEWPQ